MSSPKPAAFREEELPNSLSWVSLLTSALVYKTVLRGPWLICRRGKEDVAKVGCPFTLQSQDESLQGAWSCVWPHSNLWTLCPVPLLVFALKQPSGHTHLWELSTQLSPLPQSPLKTWRWDHQEKNWVSCLLLCCDTCLPSRPT